MLQGAKTVSGDNKWRFPCYSLFLFIASEIGVEPRFYERDHGAGDNLRTKWKLRFDPIDSIF
jgi:hypothetical protein